jgi:energy-coupling factor transport system substrate-specific component
VLTYGIATGVVAAIVSAPIVAYLFGGVTGSGSAFLVGMFLKAGQGLWNATLTSGLILDPIDKVLQVLIAALLFRATPGDFLAMVRSPAPLPRRR